MKTHRKPPRRTYDWTWAKLSKRHLQSFPNCSVVGCNKPASMVDHIETVKAAPHRRLDPTNLQSLCWGHHNTLTRAYDAGSIRGACDSDGMPLDPQHPWAQDGNAAAIVAVNTKPAVDPKLAAALKRRAVRQR